MTDGGKLSTRVVWRSAFCVRVNGRQSNHFPKILEKRARNLTPDKTKPPWSVIEPRVKVEIDDSIAHSFRVKISAMGQFYNYKISTSR